jgi:hypothetical protein
LKYLQNARQAWLQKLTQFASWSKKDWQNSTKNEPSWLMHWPPSTVAKVPADRVETEQAAADRHVLRAVPPARDRVVVAARAAPEPNTPKKPSPPTPASPLPKSPSS